MGRMKFLSILERSAVSDEKVQSNKFVVYGFLSYSEPRTPDPELSIGTDSIQQGQKKDDS